MDTRCNPVTLILLTTKVSAAIVCEDQAISEEQQMPNINLLLIFSLLFYAQYYVHF